MRPPFRGFGGLRVTASLGLVLATAGTVLPQTVTVSAQVEIVGSPSDRKIGNNFVGPSNVAIWLSPAAAALVAARSQSAPQLVQQNKAFSPHVLVVQVGSVVQFPNRDHFLHNVFSLYDGKRFDLGFYEAGSAKSVVFDRPGVSFLFCNIHPEMSAAVVAVNSPYFAVSDAKGYLQIAGVPEGNYLLHVWSEQAVPEELKRLEREVTITSKAHDLGTIAIKANPQFTTEHKNKYGQDYIAPSPSNYGHP